MSPLMREWPFSGLGFLHLCHRFDKLHLTPYCNNIKPCTESAGMELYNVVATLKELELLTNGKHFFHERRNLDS